MGMPFDPNLHDAILQQPTLDYPEGTIVTELSKGYKIGEPRVLRPTKVAVSVKPQQIDRARGLPRFRSPPVRSIRSQAVGPADDPSSESYLSD